MIDFDIPRRWSLRIYHRVDDTWTAGLYRTRLAAVAPRVIIVEGSSFEEALNNLKTKWEEHAKG